MLEITGHEHEAIDVKPFILLATVHAFDGYVSKCLSGEEVNPLDNGEGEEIEVMLLQDAISHSSWILLGEFRKLG